MGKVFTDIVLFYYCNNRKKASIKALWTGERSNIDHENNIKIN